MGQETPNGTAHLDGLDPKFGEMELQDTLEEKCDKKRTGVGKASAQTLEELKNICNKGTVTFTRKNLKVEILLILKGELTHS